MRVLLLIVMFYGVTLAQGQVSESRNIQPNTNYYKKLSDIRTTSEKKANFKSITVELNGDTTKTEVYQIDGNVLRVVRFHFGNEPVGTWKNYDENGKLISELPYEDVVYCEKSLKKEPPSSDTLDIKDAEFVGGTSNMYKFLGQNTRYPAYARDHGIQGKVYVQFIILKTGDIEYKCIHKRDNGSIYLEIEAIRVVKLMPKWNPAVLNGEPVQMLYNLPILFKLQ